MEIMSNSVFMGEKGPFEQPRSHLDQKWPVFFRVHLHVFFSKSVQPGRQRRSELSEESDLALDPLHFCW